MCPQLKGAAVKRNTKKTLLTSLSAAADRYLLKPRLFHKGGVPSIEGAAMTWGRKLDFSVQLSASLSAGLYRKAIRSGSEKRRKRRPIRTPETNILSARRTRLDQICTPPVI